jgi:hypothetical protein
MLFAFAVPFLWSSQRESLRRLRWPLTVLFLVRVAVALLAASRLVE